VNQQAAGINLSSLPSPLSAFRNRAWSKASAPKLEFDEDEVSIESEGATRLCGRDYYDACRGHELLSRLGRNR
jgi:hypothetical protein